MYVSLFSFGDASKETGAREYDGHQDNHSTV